MENEIIKQEKKKDYDLIISVILLISIFIGLGIASIISINNKKALDAFVGTYYTADKKSGIELASGGDYYVLPKKQKNETVVYDGVKFEVQITGTYKSSKDEIVFTQEYKEVVPFNENIAKAEKIRKLNPMPKSSPHPEIGTIRNQRVQRETAIYKDGKIFFSNGLVYIKDTSGNINTSQNNVSANDTYSVSNSTYSTPNTYNSQPTNNSSYTDNDSKTNSATNFYSKYVGYWYPKGDHYDNSQEINEKGGSLVEIKEFDGATIKCIIKTVQDPPANRMAQVEASGNVINNKFDFTFEDDGWLNSGKGSIEFSGDQLKLNVNILKNNDLADWCIRPYSDKNNNIFVKSSH